MIESVLIPIVMKDLLVRKGQIYQFGEYMFVEKSKRWKFMLLTAISYPRILWMFLTERKEYMREEEFVIGVCTLIVIILLGEYFLWRSFAMNITIFFFILVPIIIKHLHSFFHLHYLIHTIFYEFYRWSDLPDHSRGASEWCFMPKKMTRMDELEDVRILWIRPLKIKYRHWKKPFVRRP